MLILSIATFGMLGVLSRYYLDQLMAGLTKSAFPLGTLLINLGGSFLAGFLVILAQQKTTLSEDLKIGLLVGFCGGFTTFSAFSLQVATMMREGHFVKAFCYSLGSPVLGVALTLLGMEVCRKFLT